MKPILFNTEMINALKEGRKTQTRRVIKPEPVLIKKGMYHKNDPSFWIWIRDNYRDKTYADSTWHVDESPHTWMNNHCPYGNPGDKLWVKETWRVGAWKQTQGLMAIDYRADNYARKEWLHVADNKQFINLRKQAISDAEKIFGIKDKYKWKPGESPCRWRSPRFMPRWASRFTLEIVDVRVERVQDISEEDARSEGAQNGFYYAGEWKPTDDTNFMGYKDGFEILWNSINVKSGYGWDKNPWVWVIEFRKEEENEKRIRENFIRNVSHK